MEKILVFSDSHGDPKKMIEIIRENPIINTAIFLGDGIRDVESVNRFFPYFKIISVKGNNDFSFELPEERLLEIENRKIFITHGHNYGVKYSDSKIIAQAKKLNADILLYGHTHEPREEIIDNILVLNPGSIGYEKYTYIELEIAEKVISKIKKYC